MFDPAIRYSDKSRENVVNRSEIKKVISNNINTFDKIFAAMHKI